MVEFVVSRYKESIDWLQSYENFCRITIIEKTKNNIGREAEAYLSFIVLKYPNFSDHIIFTQADPFVHEEGGGHFSKNLSNYIKNRPNQFTWLTDWVHRTDAKRALRGMDFCDIPVDDLYF